MCMLELTRHLEFSHPVDLSLLKFHPDKLIVLIISPILFILVMIRQILPALLLT